MIKILYLQKTGLELFVGSLEAILMYALWDQDKLITMAQFYHYLIEHRLTEASYSTIITTLNRMAAKQLVTRIERTNSTPLWVKAFENEAAFIEQCMIQTLDVLENNYPDHYKAYEGLE